MLPALSTIQDLFSTLVLAFARFLADFPAFPEVFRTFQGTLSTFLDDLSTQPTSTFLVSTTTFGLETNSRNQSFLRSSGLVRRVVATQHPALLDPLWNIRDPKFRFRLNRFEFFRFGSFDVFVGDEHVVRRRDGRDLNRNESLLIDDGDAVREVRGHWRVGQDHESADFRS